MKNNEVHTKYHEHLDFPSHIPPLEKEYGTHLTTVPFEGQCNEVAKKRKALFQTRNIRMFYVFKDVCCFLPWYLYIYIYIRQCISDFFQPCKGIYFIIVSGFFALAPPCN